MSKKYLIRAGFTFVDYQGNVKGGGEIVELEDDIAALHLHKLDEPPVAKKPAKVAKPPQVEGAVAGEEDAPVAEGATAAEQPAGLPAGEEA